MPEFIQERLELLCRTLCKLRGLNPDENVSGIGPQWQEYVPELLDRYELLYS